MPSSSETSSKGTALLQTQTEKPLHYTYLKEFRVEQCPLFLQHKCTQHKPFTCFYWHFMNQRRRRPVRRRDGTFNYSPDVYCTKYDETTGICPEGDDCPYLHRTAGDTERRYHLRYYKTGICVYDTDSRGYCVKNGPHCAFAHGIHDLRNPVYDIRELQAMEGCGGGGVGNNGGSSSLNDGVSLSSSEPNSGGNPLVGPNCLDKERNALNEDPRWQDTTYVLANYKTELCKRPPRLCRQGYACPQFHNNKDRRRSPKKFKYRSTPCPNVKQGDEWGDPSNCESGDACPYCHTRTEQQFHPEIYKSTKCNDIQQTGYCPRGPFCAFAHVDKEISAARDLSMDNNTDLAALLSNALPQSSTSGVNNTNSTNANNHLVGNSSSMSNSSNNLSLNSNGTNVAVARPNNQQSHHHQSQNQQQKALTTIASSLPDHYATSFDGSSLFAGNQSIQQQLFNNDQSSHQSPATNGPGPIARPRSYSTSTATASLALGVPRDSLLSSYFKLSSDDTNNMGMNGLHSGRKVENSSSLFGGTNSPLFGNLTNNAGSLFGVPRYPTAADTLESVVGSALDDLSLDDIHLEKELEKLEKELGPNSQSLVNCTENGDNSSLTNGIMDRRSASLLGSTAPVNIPGARIGSDHRSNIGNLSSPPIGASPLTASIGHGYGVSPFGRASSVTGHGMATSATSSIYDFAAGNNVSPSSLVVQSAGSATSVVQAAASMLEIQRLKEELAISKVKIANWEEGIQQARTAIDVLKREADEAIRREKVAEQQRDEAIGRVNSLQKEVDKLSGGPYLHALRRLTELESLPVNQLQQLKQQLRNDLDCIDKVLSTRPQSSA